MPPDTVMPILQQLMPNIQIPLAMENKQMLGNSRTAANAAAANSGRNGGTRITTTRNDTTIKKYKHATIKSSTVYLGTPPTGGYLLIIN